MLGARIDDDLEPCFTASPNDLRRERGRQKPFRVIRDDHDIAFRNAGVHERQDLGLGARAGRSNVFVIESNDLLMLSDDACLSQRRETMIDRQQLDAEPGRMSFQRRTALVVAHERDERRAAAERHDVGRGIRGAAEDAS